MRETKMKRRKKATKKSRSLAAKKAWRTRKKKYGKNGIKGRR